MSSPLSRLLTFETRDFISGQSSASSADGCAIFPVSEVRDAIDQADGLVGLLDAAD